MFCSTIIPTIGRPSLTRAVESMLAQEFPADDFEVVVVNDTGRPLPPADWQCADQVRITTIQRHERCWARNSGAAIANGRYLHFLDDDDWLLPGALETWHRLVQTAASAVWFYGGALLVDRDGAPLLELHPELEGNEFTPVMA